MGAMNGPTGSTLGYWITECEQSFESRKTKILQVSRVNAIDGLLKGLELFCGNLGVTDSSDLIIECKSNLT